MTKNRKPPKRLPPLKFQKQRLAVIQLMLGLDELFLPNVRKSDPRYVLEMRPVYRRVVVNHSAGNTSTAKQIAKSSGLARETVRRILDDLVRLRWLCRRGSEFWISAHAAKSSPWNHDKAAELVLAAAKELRSKRNK